jgi:eukaryotic-like serine/threonine-protein kinase
MRSLWRVQPPPSANRELSGAVLAGGVAIANGETGLLAFDPATGEQRWTLAHARGPIVSPAVDPSAGQGGLVVFTEGLGIHTAMVAADLSTRTERWRIAFRAPIFSAPTIAEGRVYFGGRDQFLYAVDLVTGKVEWKLRVEGVIDASPAVADGRVFILSQVPQSGTSRLYAVDAVTGKVTWSFARAGGIGVSAATVSGGRVFAGFNDASVRAFDARDGTQLWSKAVRAAFAPLSSPAVAGGSLYIADAEGALYRFDERRGDRTWEFQFPAANTLAGSPLVSGRWAFLGVADGTVGAVDVDSGRLVWKVRFAGGGAGGLTPAGEVLLVPILNRHGGIVSLGHDPAGRLIDEESPTTLHVPVALANFAVAAVLVMAAVLGLFRLLSLLTRRRLARGDGAPDPGTVASADAEEGE